MLPIFEAAKDGQSKQGILGKELVQAPQAHALLPILVRPKDADRASGVPTNNNVLHGSVTGACQRMGKK